jgi:hypothetical protein
MVLDKSDDLYDEVRRVGKHLEVSSARAHNKT